MMLDAVAASDSDERVERLRRELVETASIGDPVEEMLEIAAIVEEALEPSHIYPVVVGGLAVAYWAAGAYVTYDIDVVMPSSETVNETMAALGFEREDRFWVLPGRKAFFEAPGTYLEPSPEGWTTAELPSGRRVRVQAVEEVLLVRLEEFIATGHSDVLQQCLWLRGSTAVDEDKLHARAAEQNLVTSLQALDELADRVKAGDAIPPTWELQELAKRLRERERGDTSRNR